MAFSKRNRLRKRDFKNLRLPNVVVGAYLRITYGSNATPKSRFSVVVSSKIVPKAAKRNRLRRIIRDVISSNLEKLSSGYDILVTVRNSKATEQEIRSDALATLKKLSH